MLFKMILKHLVIDFKVLVCCPLYQLDGWVMKKRKGLSILLDIHWFVRLMSGWFINTSHSSWSCSETFVMRWYLLHTRWHNRRSKKVIGEPAKWLYTTNKIIQANHNTNVAHVHEHFDSTFHIYVDYIVNYKFFSALLPKNTKRNWHIGLGM
jgi:hypothetical protein